MLFNVHLKHTSFWSSADIKPTPNGQAPAMPSQCMFVHSICILLSLSYKLSDLILNLMSGPYWRKSKP